MDTFYGILLIVYVIVFAAWRLGLRDTAAAKQLYSREQPKQKVRVVLSLRQKVAWSTGLAALLIAWAAMWPPTIVSSLLLGGGAIAWGVKSVNKRFHPLSKPHFRYWAAGSLVWVAAVGGWVMIFGRTSRLHTDEIVLLAAIPPAIAALAYIGWRWAKNPQ